MVFTAEEVIPAGWILSFDFNELLQVHTDQQRSRIPGPVNGPLNLRWHWVLEPNSIPKCSLTPEFSNLQKNPRVPFLSYTSKATPNPWNAPFWMPKEFYNTLIWEPDLQMLGRGACFQYPYQHQQLQISGPGLAIRPRIKLWEAVIKFTPSTDTFSVLMLGLMKTRQLKSSENILLEDNSPNCREQWKNYNCV